MDPPSLEDARRNSHDVGLLRKLSVDHSWVTILARAQVASKPSREIGAVARSSAQSDVSQGQLLGGPPYGDQSQRPR